MTQQAELLNRIDRMPRKYFGEIIDFLGYLQHKAQYENDDEVAAYKAMAADTEREQEALEWCNACFGPK